MKETWTEPLKRVEQTLTEKVSGIGHRIDRHDQDIDDIRSSNRDMFLEQRKWMVTLTEKLDRRPEALNVQSNAISSMVDKLSVIEVSNSKGLETLTKNVTTVNNAVAAITPIVMDYK